MVSLLPLLLSCNGTEPATESGPEPLAPTALLSRLSLDLRGRRPTEAELLAVEADPDAVDSQIDTYLADPGFGERIFWLYADLYKTRADRFIVGVDGDGDLLDEAPKSRFTHSVGDEPLRILQYVADHDLPWTDIATADWTMANDDLLEHWPLEALEEGTGWRKARYTDSRPGAGVLSTNGMWWRYTSTAENINRSRAEATSRLLVCETRYDQPIEFSSSSGALTDLQDRAQNDENCVACHVVLDPLGSYFFGFWRMHPESYSEAIWYYPNRELLWQSASGIHPAWYGEQGDSLYDLGQQIAADPRFVTCAVQQAFGFLFGRKPTEDDTARLTAYREAFLEGGLTARSLYGAIVRDPLYQSDDADTDGAVTPKRLAPDQLGAAVEALTGFTWTYNELDMLSTDTWGVRVLAGGMDGIIVTEAATDHATSAMLVDERLAEAAAAAAVTRESALDAADRTLFQEVDTLSETPDEATLAAQITALVWRAHGRHLTDAELDAWTSLWSELLAQEGDPQAAWALLLSAALRHPDFLHY